MFRTAECVKIGKYRIALDLSRIRNLQMSGVGKHPLDLSCNFLCRVRKVYAVTQRLAHLCLAVSTRESHTSLIVRKKYLWLYKNR